MTTAKKDDIIAAVQLPQLLAKFMRLYPRGNNFAGYCPFHNGARPSLFVNTKSGLWQCNECNKRGGAIEFLTEYFGYNFDEALYVLAHECGMTTDLDLTGNEAIHLLEANAFANNYYQSQLYDTVAGKEIALTYYHLSRHFSDETIRKFGLGYSPAKSNNRLVELAAQSDIDRQSLIASGICVKGDAQNTYDHFHDRVTFPVYNLLGQSIAISARTLSTEPRIPKYVNSSETAIYTKGKELFGLYHARESILSNDECILVEGNADVVSMHQAGFSNTVAALGTGFTSTQASLIRRFTQNIILMFDGDQAGKKATYRALKLLLPLGLNVKVSPFPNGEDPDSFAQSHTFEQFQEHIKSNAVDFVDYIFADMLHGRLNNPIATVNVSREIIDNISLMPDPVARTTMAQKSSHLLGIAEESILRDVQKAIIQHREDIFKQQQQEQVRLANSNKDNAQTLVDEGESDELRHSILFKGKTGNATTAQTAPPKETVLMHYVVKYAMVEFSQEPDEDGETTSLTLLEYVVNELNANQLKLTYTVYNDILRNGVARLAKFHKDLEKYIVSQQAERDEVFANAITGIDPNGGIDAIKEQEDNIAREIDATYARQREEYRTHYFANLLRVSDDRETRLVTLTLLNDNYQLSKIHTQSVHIKTEYECLDTLVQDAINNLRYDDINAQIKLTEAKMKKCANDDAFAIMAELQELHQRRSILASYLGERVINL